MTFLDRPDRILKALPFITGKATWDAAGRADNGSHSYPFDLWRTVTPAGTARPATASASADADAVFVETHLHKWYAAFADVDGDRIVARADAADLQVQGFRSRSNHTGGDTDGDATTLTLVMNNLAFARNGNRTVTLSWPAEVLVAASVITIKRLYWDEATATPQLELATLESSNGVGGGTVPSQLELRPAELVVLRLSINTSAAVGATDVDGTAAATGRTINEQTVYPDRVLQPMASSPDAAAGAPYRFVVPNRTRVVTMRVRVGFGGSAGSTMGSEAAFARTVAGMGIKVGGVACKVQMTSTSFLARFPRNISCVPPCTRRAMCPARRPRSSDADWCWQSDVVPDSGLQVDPARQVAGPLHINAKDFTYFTSIEVEATGPITVASGEVEVLVWSTAGDHSTVASTVVLTVLTAE